MQKLKNIGLLFKTAFKSWWEKDPFRESAVIAYYAIFALPGLFVVIMTIAGYFLGSDTAQEHLNQQISSTIGADTAKQVQVIVDAASQSQNSIWATVIGIATILIGATGVFVQFQKSLNTIWEVEVDESKSGVWSLIKLRLFSFGLIVAIAFIMIVSLAVTSLLMAIGDWLARQFSESILILIQVLNFIISKVIIFMLFALMYKYFADAKIKWNHIWLGSGVTTILFFLGMYGMSIYFGQAEPGSGYGAAGSVILILLWVSYSSMIVFYGAEFTYAYAVSQDGQIEPDENGMKIQGNLITNGISTPTKPNDPT
jgi:membrane protein